MECHGVTLLPQFLGMYRLNVDGVEIYVIVTRNVFSHRLSVYRKYDLKVRLTLIIFNKFHVHLHKPTRPYCLCYHVNKMVRVLQELESSRQLPARRIKQPMLLQACQPHAM